MATYNGHNEDASGNILLSIGNGMTATLETGTTASQAYTKGAYLYYNNRLCKVTSAIASGNTLTIGTNIAYTTLGEELTSHLKATNGDEFYFDYKDGEPGYYPSASKTASEFVPIGGTADLALSRCTKKGGTYHAYFTCTADTRIFISSRSHENNSTLTAYMQVYLNGTLNYTFGNGKAPITFSGYKKYDLNAGDTIDIKYYISGGGNSYTDFYIYYDANSGYVTLP